MQHTVFDWIAGICVLGATLGCIYTLIAFIAVLRFARINEQRSSPTPPVTVMVPLYGAETHLFERCASLCRQDYAGPVQLVFGTHDVSDPAIDVVRRLQAAFPARAIALEIEPSTHGANRKVSNLVNMMPLVRHDIIVMVDSDIDVGEHYLSAMVGKLCEASVGAVTAPHHGMAGAGLWSRFSALAINTHFLPHAVAAIALGLAKPCFGASIAIRRETLSLIGGFAAFADSLADDYMIGQAVRCRALKIAFPAFTVGHVCFERSLEELLTGQLRSGRTIRSIDPLGYAGSILTHPFPLALLAAIFGAAGALLVPALVLSVVALGCRGTLALGVERAFGLKRQDYWALPLQELLLFMVYFVSFFGGSVTWRGRRFRIMSGGQLASIE
jgi:ceramide glucosyltransferase